MIKILPRHYSKRAALVVAIAGSLAFASLASAVTLTDNFDGTGTPTAWSPIPGLADPGASYALGGGFLTTTDVRSANGDGGGPALLRSATSFDPNTAVTAQVNVASTAGRQTVILAIGNPVLDATSNPNPFALVVQFNTDSSQFGVFAFRGGDKPDVTYSIPAVTTLRAPGTALSFTLTSTTDSFNLVCPALNYDSGDIAFAADFPTSSQMIIGTSVEGNDAQASTKFDSVSLNSTDVLTDAKATSGAVAQAVTALVPSGDASTDSSLSKASGTLAAALAPSLWVDGNHLYADTGFTVYDGLKQTAGTLATVYNASKTPAAVRPAALSAMNTLVTISINLATTAISDAIVASGNAGKISSATKTLAKAAKADQAGKVDTAIEHGKQAWKQAQDAVRK